MVDLAAVEPQVELILEPSAVYCFGRSDSADSSEEGPFSTLRGAWIILLAFIDGSLIVELGMLSLKSNYPQSGTVWQIGDARAFPSPISPEPSRMAKTRNYYNPTINSAIFLRSKHQ